MELRPILLSLKHNKFFALLIIVQVALTLAVVSNALFVTTSTLKEWNLPSGLAHRQIISVKPQFFAPDVSMGQIIREDIDRLSQLPGVTAVTPNSEAPFEAEAVRRVYVDTRDDAEGFQTVVINGQANMTQVLGLTLLEGRGFNRLDEVWGAQGSEAASAAVVMISEAMAQVLFPDESPLGKTIWLAQNSDPVEVVGVYSNFMTGEELNFYGMSFRSILRPQVSWQTGVDPNYLLRVEPGVDDGIFEEIRNTLYQTKGRYVYSVERLSRVQKRMYDGRGSNALILLVVSLVLVLITAFGTGGLVSFLVNQRKRQIGTRRALGASKWAVVRYFLVENTLVTWIGLLLGAGLTISIAFLLNDAGSADILDPAYLVMTGLALWLINIFAVWLPARRAANVPPSIVTRAG